MAEDKPEFADLQEVVKYQHQVLQSVERWANHHGTESFMTPEQVLSNIQHHPAIRNITKSYVDGKVPDTPNPWAKIAELEAALAKSNEQVASLQEALDNLAPYDVSPVTTESAVRAQLDIWNKVYKFNPDPLQYEATVKMLTLAATQDAESSVGVEDKQLRNSLQQKVKSLEQSFDAIGNTRIRQAISCHVVAIYQLLRGSNVPSK